MNAITFDTLKFAQTLEDAGMDRKQATAIAQAVRDSHETAELATKTDIRELKVATTSDIRELQAATTSDLLAFKAEMKVEMRELEMRLMLKLGSLMVVLMGLMLAVLKL